jgi:hypothetical protein
MCCTLPWQAATFPSALLRVLGACPVSSGVMGVSGWSDRVRGCLVCFGSEVGRFCELPAGGVVAVAVPCVRPGIMLGAGLVYLSCSICQRSPRARRSRFSLPRTGLPAERSRVGNE